MVDIGAPAAAAGAALASSGGGGAHLCALEASRTEARGGAGCGAILGGLVGRRSVSLLALGCLAEAGRREDREGGQKTKEGKVISATAKRDGLEGRGGACCESARRPWDAGGPEEGSCECAGAIRRSWPEPWRLAPPSASTAARPAPHANNRAAQFWTPDTVKELVGSLSGRSTCHCGSRRDLHSLRTATTRRIATQPTFAPVLQPGAERCSWELHWGAEPRGGLNMRAFYEYVQAACALQQGCICEELIGKVRGGLAASPASGR